jgi:hypothetical protein
MTSPSTDILRDGRQMNVILAAGAPPMIRAQAHSPTVRMRIALYVVTPHGRSDQVTALGDLWCIFEPAAHCAAYT